MMKWKTAIIETDQRVQIPKRWLHIHYYEALNILFRFENSLRMFVYVILKNKEFDEWENCNFTPTGTNEQLSIQQAARRRISQAETFGYIGYDIRAPLMHITSGELVDLITQNGYWPVFAKYFRGNKEIIKNKLLEIGSIRNSLAHFRPIKADDIEVAKQNCRHTLMGVEECLSNIVLQHLRVPTNTKDNWYQSIRTLGTDRITTTPFYSEDEQWINLNLLYHTPILHKRRLGEEQHYSFTLANIKVPNILVHHSDLKKYVTYAGENNTYPRLNDSYDVEVPKSINLVFGRAALEQHHETIAAALQQILKTVSDECEMLEKDPGARGTMIESAYGSTWWTAQKDSKGQWSHHYESLKQKYDPSHPSEYWGPGLSSSDVVAGSVRYPWMPDDISSTESIFDFMN